MQAEALIQSYCQVLGTGDDGSSPCLLVSVERAPKYSGGEPTKNTILRRYLFNVGEGTQRFCGEHGVKLATVNKLFLTGTGAEEHAGLSGLVLTLSALGAPALEVFGPTGVDKLVKGLRSFAHRTYPQVTATPLQLGRGESQCSYVLGDEHLEVRCGVFDPARLGASQATSIASSISSGESDGDSDSDSDNSSSCSSGGEESESSSRSSSSSSSSSNDSDVGVVPCPSKPRIDGASAAGGNGGSTAGPVAESAVKGTDKTKMPEVVGRPRLDVDLTEHNRLDQGTAMLSHKSGAGDDREKLQESAGKPTSSYLQNGKNGSRGEMVETGRDSIKSPEDGKVGQTPRGAPRGNSLPAAGIPARGPAVVYRCRVLHGVGSSFLVLSCPNVGYVRSLLHHSIVKGAMRDDRVLFVLHLSPEDVVDLPAYAPLLTIRAKHILLGCGPRGREQPGAGRLQHRKIAERSVQLHFVAPQAFPLHYALRSLDGIPDVSSTEVVQHEVEGNRTLGQPLMKAVLLPVAARGVDLSAVHPPPDVAAIREDMQKRVEEAGLSDERARIVESLAASHGLPSIDNGSTGRSPAVPMPIVASGGGTETCSRATTKPPELEGSKSMPSPKRRRRLVDILPSTPPDIFKWPLPPPPPPPPLPESPAKLPVLSGNGPPPPAARAPLFSGGGLGGAAIFFLGTGSAAPSKNRGCSGILVRIPQWGLCREGNAEAGGEPLRLLIDAGEGTLGHLERQFGRDGGLKEIEGLDCVWISHKHADHHSGLFRVLAAHHRAVAARRARETTTGVPGLTKMDPLTVVAPSDVLAFLESSRQASGEVVTYRPMNCSSFIRHVSWCGGASVGDGCAGGRGGTGSHGRYGAAVLLDGLASVPVVHCKESYGLVLQLWTRGAKLVYSGDTRPCDRLVAAGAGAALLIHEATFDDSKIEDAVSKRHSTTSEALEVGRRMRAGQVVLTHFSQRYPRVPVLERGHAQQFCVAFDGMVLNRATHAVLPSAASLLSQILERKAEEEDDDDDAEEITLV